MISHAKRVVAGGSGNDAALALLRVEHSSALQAPRSLKLPVRWRYSSLQ